MAAIGTLPDVDQLRQAFSYNPTTGDIRHLSRPESMFKSVRDCRAWNTLWAGKSAVSITGRYPTVTFKAVKYSAHRIAWALHYSQHPALPIDHINNDPTDNRICNLRLATQSQNNANRPISTKNRTGIKGVSWHKRYKKFAANITVNGRAIYLGRFNTAEEAASAYRDAAIAYFGEFARLE